MMDIRFEGREVRCHASEFLEFVGQVEKEGLDWKTSGLDLHEDMPYILGPVLGPFLA